MVVKLVLWLRCGIGNHNRTTTRLRIHWPLYGGRFCGYYGCIGVIWLKSHIFLTGDYLVKIKADVMALARLIRYSEEEALRLGVSEVVVECLRMAGIELTNRIDKAVSGENAKVAGVARMN